MKTPEPKDRTRFPISPQVGNPEGMVYVTLNPTVGFSVTLNPTVGFSVWDLVSRVGFSVWDLVSRVGFSVASGI